MHSDFSSRLIAIVFAFFFGALAVSGASGYVSPAQAQPPEQQEPIIVMATPRLPPAMPTEPPPPTAVPVPTEVLPQSTPEPVVVVHVQYVEVPVVVPVEMPPTVAMPTPFPTVSHTRIEGWVEMERPKVFEARPVRRPGDAPEAAGP